LRIPRGGLHEMLTHEAFTRYDMQVTASFQSALHGLKGLKGHAVIMTFV